jgi:hypothetical protein
MENESSKIHKKAFFIKKITFSYKKYHIKSNINFLNIFSKSVAIFTSKKL